MDTFRVDRSGSTPALEEAVTPATVKYYNTLADAQADIANIEEDEIIVVKES